MLGSSAAVDLRFVFPVVVPSSSIIESSVNSPSEGDKEESDCTTGCFRALGGCMANSSALVVAVGVLSMNNELS